MVDKAEFAERLRKAVIAAGYDPKPGLVHKQFNTHWHGRPVSFQAARAWLIGTSVPEDRKLAALADWLDVTPEFLRYGNRPARDVREPAPAWMTGLSAYDRGSFDALMSLPAAERRRLGELIRAQAAKFEKP